MELINGLLAIIAAYLLGAIPFGLLIGKLAAGTDPRASGSGNIGATNVLRTAGKWAGAATLALDLIKGVAAVWIAGELTGGAQSWMGDAALAAVVGHIYPVYLQFQGGKGVATFAGAFGFLLPLPLVATAAVFAGTLYLTRYVSAGSIVGAATFPFGALLLARPSLVTVLCSLIAAGLVIYRHIGNMQRIRAGTEAQVPWGLRKTSNVVWQNRARATANRASELCQRASDQARRWWAGRSWGRKNKGKP